MSKPKVLGMEYGIKITKPWSPAMYEHNDKVSANMKEAIFEALSKAYKLDNEDDVRTISKAICAYGHGEGYDLDGIYADACRELDMTQNHWLDSSCWPDLVKAGLVEDLEVKFVGYKKTLYI